MRRLQTLSPTSSKHSWKIPGIMNSTEVLRQRTTLESIIVATSERHDARPCEKGCNPTPRTRRKAGFLAKACGILVRLRL